MISPTHDLVLKATSLAYETLPVMDGAQWSGTGKNPAGMWPVRLFPDGSTSVLSPAGPPEVQELNKKELSIRQPLEGGGCFSIICSESKVTFTGVDGDGKPLNWACDLTGGARQAATVQRVAPEGVAYRYHGIDYQLKLGRHAGSCEQSSNGGIRFLPNPAGKLELISDVTRR